MESYDYITIGRIGTHEIVLLPWMDGVKRVAALQGEDIVLSEHICHNNEVSADYQAVLAIEATLRLLRKVGELS